MTPQHLDEVWPTPPPWRDFGADPDVTATDEASSGAQTSVTDDSDAQRVLGSPLARQVPDLDEVTAVNTAIYLRRPLLVTGQPGTGKSSLAHRIARELGLGRVLRWPITSRSTLTSGQYEYDAIGRARALHEHRAPDPLASQENIGKFIQLGPLGTAMIGVTRPRVLLIDELDKGDIDLPNDLLNIFEEGRFIIPELVRIRETQASVTVFTADPGSSATIHHGVIQCREFPIIVMTSNAEREFPAAFRRRCLPLELRPPSREKLLAMVQAHFPDVSGDIAEPLVGKFLRRSDDVGGLAADQFLNAIQLATRGVIDLQDDAASTALLENVWHPLTTAIG
jgi:MoxR-like ATPase